MNSTALAASPLPAPMTRIDGNARAAWGRPESAGARRGRRYSVRVQQALDSADPGAQRYGSRIQQALLNAYRCAQRPGSRIRQALLGAHPGAQLLRFALVGGASNISYLLLFLACTGLGAMTANAAGSIVSTMIANELHRRITFRAAGRISWLTAQWQGGGLALIGLLTSTAALAVIEFVAPALDELTRAGLVLAVMAAVGGFRFLALRGLF
ncbi:GtrA family protein [Nocardia cyriacigeorgica]|uniref:GtrA-like protein n=1 Tax=Nocardia cyriacigeorgica TaxID=135487 RepID=A0A4U8W1N2_9NOCA|nr:GtrA family protein [Nocardia cyriacigeorgica]VFA99926.1 GtrA-like protein [Nocardia cyriacigeorgica]